MKSTSRPVPNDDTREEEPKYVEDAEMLQISCAMSGIKVGSPCPFLDCAQERYQVLFAVL